MDVVASESLFSRADARVSILWGDPVGESGGRLGERSHCSARAGKQSAGATVAGLFSRSPGWASGGTAVEHGAGGPYAVDGSGQLTARGESLLWPCENGGRFGAVLGCATEVVGTFRPMFGWDSHPTLSHAVAATDHRQPQ
jgi:hypothetical protein